MPKYTAIVIDGLSWAAAATMATHGFFIFGLFLLSALFNISREQIILAPAKWYANEENDILLISGRDVKAEVKFVNSNDVIHKEIVHLKQNEIIWKRFNIGLYEEEVDIELWSFNELLAVGRLELEQSVGGYVVMQTDKPIYRRDDRFRVRAMRLDRTLVPKKEKMVLKVFNSQNIVVEETTLEGGPPFHVAEFESRFPPTVPFGTWKLQLYYGGKLTQFVETSIKIADYILPLFEIIIEAPKYVLLQDQNLSINTRAQYTFGKPVRGKIVYNFRLKCSSFQKDFESIQGDSTNGRYVVHVPMTNFSEEMSRWKEKTAHLDVEVTVTDTSTGHAESITKNDIIVSSQKYKIVMHQSLLYYKPGLNSFVSFKVLDPPEDIVPNIDATVTLSNESIKLFKIDATTFRYMIDENIGALSGKISIDEEDCKVDHDFTIKPIDNEPASVSLENKVLKTYRAGDVFETQMASKGKINQVYVVLLSKGRVIHVENIRNKIQFKVTLTNKMAPYLQLIVIGSTDSHVGYVADSLVIEVEQHKCSVQIDLETKDSVRPGANFTLNLTGRPGDIVGVHAIDKSLQLFGENILTPKTFKDILSKNKQHLESDKISKTFDEVIENSGMRIFEKPGTRIFKKPGTRIFENSGIRIFKKPGTRIFEKPGMRIFGKPGTRIFERLGMRIFDFPLERRFRRSIEDIEELKPWHCCRLAGKLFDGKKTCDYGYKVLRRQVNEQCARSYLRCCDKIEPAKFASGESVSTRSRDLMSVHEKQVQQLEASKAESVRIDFRETWLFDMILMNHSSESYTSKLPHTITTWSLSTFSMSREHGLCVNPLESVTTFRPFFIKVAFPAQIKQFEHSQIQVTVFNYHTNKASLDIQVTFNNYGKSLCSYKAISQPISNFVRVRKDSLNTTFFDFIGIKPGPFLVEIIASDEENRHFDIVKKVLTIIPDGVTVNEKIVFDLDPSNLTEKYMKFKPNEYLEIQTANNKQEAKFHLNHYIKKRAANHLPSSMHAEVMFMGTRVNVRPYSIETLSQLLNKPHGCGEQNLFYMAFNVHTLVYTNHLYNNNSRFPEAEHLHRQGMDYIQRAYANQLTFRKADGSFGVFELTPSSVWLTAFVSKTFCKARQLLGTQLDVSVITKAIEWITKHCKHDQKTGTAWWEETETIMHSKAFGAGKQNALTAYVLIALRECQPVLNVSNMLDLSKVEKFLKEQLYAVKRSSLNDNLFTWSLVLYALSYNADNKKFLSERVSQFNQKAKKDWEKNYIYWDTDYSIETTAYGLLMNLQQNETIEKVKPIVNWLGSRQVNGTFESTQDTVVAIEALGTFYSKLNLFEKNKLHLRSKVYANGKLERSIEFDERNLYSLQSFVVENATGTEDIVVQTNGNIVGKAELHLTYQVEKSTNKKCLIDLRVRMCPWQRKYDRKLSIFDNNPSKLKELSRIIENMEKNRPKRSLQLDTMCNFRNEIFRPWDMSNSINSDIRIIKACVQSQIERSLMQEMITLEISLPTGYQVNRDDLQQIPENSILVDKYDIHESKVVFYFRFIDEMRPFCLQFRVVRTILVKNVKPVLAKIYRYYQDESCTVMYTAPETAEKSEKPNYKCVDKQACYCTNVKPDCPNDEEMHEIKIGLPEHNQDFFKLLYCHYSNIFKGKINRIQTDISPWTFEVKIVAEYKGTTSTKFRINAKCKFYSLNDHPEVLIMHNAEVEDYILLDATTTLYALGDKLHPNLQFLNQSSVMNESLAEQYKCQTEMEHFNNNWHN